MRLSVVIPCYNETKTTDAIIDAVHASPYPNKEIVIVYDCSRDGTREKLKTEIEASRRVSKVLYHPVNQGKGAALRAGIIGAMATWSSSRRQTGISSQQISQAGRADLAQQGRCGIRFALCRRRCASRALLQSRQ